MLHTTVHKKKTRFSPSIGYPILSHYVTSGHIKKSLSTNKLYWVITSHLDT